MPTNVLGTELKCCCRDPLTGFYRDGFCRTGPEDLGLHTVCVSVTREFLDFSVLDGNDLVTPHPEWAAFTNEAALTLDGPHAAGIPATVRIIWVPVSKLIVVRNLGSQGRWAAAYFDPVNGARKELGAVRADETGLWRCDSPPGYDHDWVLILEAKSPGAAPPSRETGASAEKPAQPHACERAPRLALRLDRWSPPQLEL